MKLTGRTMADFLRAPDKACVAVLVYGPDAGAARERTKLMTRAVLKVEPDGMNVSFVPAERLKDDPAALADALCSMSLLGGANVVVLENATDKHTKTIQQALELPGRTHYLIACADELPGRSSLRQMFETKENLAALPCYRDEAQDIAGLVRQHLETHKIRASRDVVEYLSQHLGNDRMVTRSELEKITLYLGDDKELTAEKVFQLVGHNREVALDEVALCVASRDLRGVDERLQQVFREGTSPIALLRSAQRYFQRLFFVREQMRLGKSAEGAIAGLRPAVFFRHQAAFAQQVQGWDEAALGSALGVLAAAELACKNSGADGPLLVSRAFMSVSRMGAKSKIAAA